MAREDAYSDGYDSRKEADRDIAIEGVLPIPGTTIQNPSDHFVILGDLALPRPPDELKERAERLERDLKDLDNRNMEGKLSSLF